MHFNELVSRINEGECVPCALINGRLVDEFINKNPQQFKDFVMDDDIAQSDVMWIYSKEARSQHEYNPPFTGRYK